MSPKSIRFLIVVLLALLLLPALVACERPEPEETVALTVEPTATPYPTFTPVPTSPPVQVYVVIVQPTPGSEPAATAQMLSMSAQNEQMTATPSPSATPEPTMDLLEQYYEENYYLGWVWNDSLVFYEKQTVAGGRGLEMLDRPDREGTVVGLVVGHAPVVVAGKASCGYTPVLAHASNMLMITTPRPPIHPPVPLGASETPTPLAPLVTNRGILGWAYTDELTIIGQTAIVGPLGIILRAEACRYGDSLGFVPAGSDIFVTGTSRGEYTPVRVAEEVLQVPVAPLDTFPGINP